MQILVNKVEQREKHMLKNYCTKMFFWAHTYYMESKFSQEKTVVISSLFKREKIFSTCYFYLFKLSSFCKR